MIRISKGIPIFVYRLNSDGLTLINNFPSASKASEFFNVSYHTNLKYMPQKAVNYCCVKTNGHNILKIIAAQNNL